MFGFFFCPKGDVILYQKGKCWIYVCSVFTPSCMNWFYFHTSHFALIQVPRRRWVSCLYLFSIRKCSLANEINVYLCDCCLLITVCPAVSLRRKTCVLNSAITSFRWLIVSGPRNWTLALLPVFFYINRFYFINAFWWWRVITASYFEFVCSGLLWYNLLTWLLGWIKKATLTHSCVAASGNVSFANVCLVAWWCGVTMWCEASD